MRRWLGLLLLMAPAYGQTACQPTPMYTPCEISMEVSEETARRMPNLYKDAEIWGEFRSPEYKTYRMPAFWDGGRKFVLRFSMTQLGPWTVKLTGNVPEMAGKELKLEAITTGDDGFLKPANLHHWMFPDTMKPHLWMGDTNYGFATMDRAAFEKYADTRKAQKFNHIRGLVLPWGDAAKAGIPSADEVNPAYFQELDARMRILNERGFFTDLILAGDEDAMAKLFPTAAQRERYLRYVVARYGAYHVTWQLAQEFEEYRNGREVMRELGLALKRLDPYGHPRTAHTVSTSAPLANDGWMDYITYQTSDDAVVLVEHLMFAKPQVNAEFAYEDSGAGKSHAHHVDPDTFRKRLWNATMDGAYVTYGNTGTYGGKKFPFDARYLDAPGAKAMTAWFDFFSRTRYWDLEPYFDLNGGRALALPDVEYIVYMEKYEKLELTVEQHSYYVYWLNTATGEVTKEKKEWKGTLYETFPPDQKSDWVLHLSRDGRKEGMLRSYKFESRLNELQEIDLAKLPYELMEPKFGEQLTVGKPVPFEIRLKRQTPGTRRMTYLIVGENSRDGQGYRVFGSGAKGTITVPPGILLTDKGSVAVRVLGLNAGGKLYAQDLVFPIVRGESK